jgi:hypothetical protein
MLRGLQWKLCAEHLQTRCGVGMRRPELNTRLQETQGGCVESVVCPIPPSPASMLLEKLFLHHFFVVLPRVAHFFVSLRLDANGNAGNHFDDNAVLCGLVVASRCCCTIASLVPRHSTALHKQPRHPLAWPFWLHNLQFQRGLLLLCFHEFCTLQNGCIVLTMPPTGVVVAAKLTSAIDRGAKWIEPKSIFSTLEHRIARLKEWEK